MDGVGEANRPSGASSLSVTGEAQTLTSNSVYKLTLIF